MFTSVLSAGSFWARNTSRDNRRDGEIERERDRERERERRLRVFILYSAGFLPHGGFHVFSYFEKKIISGFTVTRKKWYSSIFLP